MNYFNITRHPLISVVGGIEEGKTFLIKALWGDQCKSTTITEEVPGRGSFQYQVKELSPIIFSLGDIWLSNEDNIKCIRDTDTLIYLIPSQSFGYDEEFTVLKQIKEINPSMHIILVCTKIDLLFGTNTKRVEFVEELLRTERTIMNTTTQYLECCALDDIVMFSAKKKWNIEVLRERIWDNLIEKLNDTIYDSNIPTLVISGKRGCGKSSTLNRMFNLNLPINMATACTKYPRVLHVETETNGTITKFNLVDLPGIAESIDADTTYAAYYKKYIEKASVLLCLSQADTRAYLQDQLFYNSLIESKIINKKTRILLGINQVDLLYKTVEQPDGIDLNSLPDADAILKDKISDFYSIYQNLFKEFDNISESNVIGFSAIQNWHIDILKNTIINNLKN